MRGVWTGGKPIGSVRRRRVKDGDVEYHVDIEKKDGTTDTTSFFESDYGSEAKARRAAVEFHKKRAAALGGLLLNQYYIVESPHNSNAQHYAVVDLSSVRDILAGKQPDKHRVMTCNLFNIAIVERYLWQLKSGMAVCTDSRFYDADGGGDGGGGGGDGARDAEVLRAGIIYFHNMAIPDVRFDEGYRVVHKDRNRPLDNRVENLSVLDRSSYLGVKMECRGEEGREYWRTTWREDGKPYVRSFSVKKYGNENAKIMAQDVARAISIQKCDGLSSSSSSKGVMDVMADPHNVWKKDKRKRQSDSDDG